MSIHDTILKTLDGLSNDSGVIQCDPEAATHEIMAVLDRRTAAEQAVIDRFSNRSCERLLRIIAPGRPADGRLIRQVFQNGSWTDAPIPRQS